MNNFGPFGVQAPPPYWPVFTDYEIDNGILRPTRNAEIKEYYSPLVWGELAPRHLRVLELKSEILPSQLAEIMGVKCTPNSERTTEGVINSWRNFDFPAIEEEINDTFLYLDKGPEHNDKYAEAYLQQAIVKAEESLNNFYVQFKKIIIEWVSEFGLPYVQTNQPTDSLLTTKHMTYGEEVAVNHFNNGLDMYELIWQFDLLNRFITVYSLLKRYAHTTNSNNENQLILEQIRQELTGYYGEDIKDECNELKMDDLKESFWLDKAEMFLALLIEEHTKSSKVLFSFWNRKSQIRWQHVTPLDSFYLHLITAKGVPLKCANSLCPNYFTPKRDEQKYCSEDCQRKSKNRAIKARSALKKKIMTLLQNGASLETIASKQEIEISLLKSWLKEWKER